MVFFLGLVWVGFERKFEGGGGGSRVDGVAGQKCGGGGKRGRERKIKVMDGRLRLFAVSGVGVCIAWFLK